MVVILIKNNCIENKEIVLIIIVKIYNLILDQISKMKKFINLTVFQFQTMFIQKDEFCS